MINYDNLVRLTGLLNRGTHLRLKLLEPNKFN